nr:reverse transcriptase domain, reverse transcriptase zinc-binding domain protein [Tanacetum cinerariifolium]
MNQVDMQGRQTQSYVGNFSNDGIDLYDSDYDDISTAKAVLMANLSSYDSNVLSEFLGTEGATKHLDDHDLYTRVLDTTKANFMVRDVTDIEVKNVIFSMGDDKALDWKFLETILVDFGFHLKMVQWIMVCVSGASYSICVNGNLHGWFKRKRDDLFLFSCGHPNSVFVIMDALEEFKQVSGLVPSIPKSTTFFCNIPNAIKASILNSMPFVEGEMMKWNAKVVWDSVCMPKHEGGLDVCPLKNMLSNRDIARSVFSLDDSVSNLIYDGACKWPPDWLSRFPFMAQLQVPLLLDDMDDVILWHDRDGDLQSFLVACVWDTIRSRADMVQWYNIVWFPHYIPYHAIHMWLVVEKKLKTQDRLWQWDVGPSIDLNLLRCPLCELVLDSHDHLFFKCSFSLQVWSQVRVLCGMNSISPQLTDVIAFIIPISKGKMIISILSRIVVATTSYYIWLERNGRLFKKKTSSPDQIVQVILSMVRLKLVNFKFKNMATSVISSQHAAGPVIDDEETLILEEVSRSKMLAKQNDPMSKEKKVDTTLINYVELNRFSKDFGKRFVPQQELSAEQAFWLQTSHPNTDQSASSPVKIKAPREILKVSLVNKSLKKLQYHLGQFDTVVKKHITPDAITEGEWGFKHTKKPNGSCYDQCSVDKKLFEIEKKELKLENERLLEHIICQDVVNIVRHADDKYVNVLPVKNTFLDDNIAFDGMKMENGRLMVLLVSQDLVHTAVNSLAAINDYKNMERSYIEEYERNLKLADKLSQMNKLLKTFSRLKKRCMYLELKLKHNKESFQNDKPCENQDAPEFREFFIINELKAQLQAKDTTISILKKHI